jgi:hypothetical protein
MSCGPVKTLVHRGLGQPHGGGFTGAQSCWLYGLPMLTATKAKDRGGGSDPQQWQKWAVEARSGSSDGKRRRWLETCNEAKLRARTRGFGSENVYGGEWWSSGDNF